MRDFVAKIGVSLILLCILTTCISAPKANLLKRAPIFAEIERCQNKLEVPIGGSYSQGLKRLKMANAVGEANAVFKVRGPVLLFPVTGWTFLGVGTLGHMRKILKKVRLGEVKMARMPALVDVVNSKTRDYNREADMFVYQFNYEMVSLARL